MEEKKIEKLYELLERAERERDAETAAALRWAIFQLESRLGGQNPPFSLAFLFNVVYYGYIYIIAILGKITRYKYAKKSSWQELLQTLENQPV